MGQGSLIAFLCRPFPVPCIGSVILAVSIFPTPAAFIQSCRFFCAFFRGHGGRVFWDAFFGTRFWGTRFSWGTFRKSPPNPENLVRRGYTDEISNCSAPCYGAGHCFFSYGQTERYCREQLGAAKTLSALRLGSANRAETFLMDQHQYHYDDVLTPSPRQ